MVDHHGLCAPDRAPPGGHVFPVGYPGSSSFFSLVGQQPPTVGQQHGCATAPHCWAAVANCWAAARLGHSSQLLGSRAAQQQHSWQQCCCSKSSVGNSCVMVYPGCQLQRSSCSATVANAVGSPLEVPRSQLLCNKFWANFCDVCGTG